MPKEVAIDNLGLPNEIAGALCRKGIMTVEELRKLTREELMSIRTIGPSRVRQIEQALKQFGSLGKEQELPMSYFEEPTATKLEELRATARTKRLITYDCYNAIVTARTKRLITYDCYNAIVTGTKVNCKKGYSFALPGRPSRAIKGIPLLSVLRGRSSKVCQSCPDYEDE